jgi:bifunctional UDP-N-acetylglucosamine pyrophosphorylase/glucosamine-1-phosphate N-acetyltransferase
MNSEIKVYIIDEPFEHSDMEILGLPVKEYAVKALQELEPVFASRADIKGGGNIAVIYTDTPLVTVNAIKSIIGILEEQNIDSMALGRGYVSRAGIIDKNPAVNYGGEESIRVSAATLPDIYRAISMRNVDTAIRNGAIILDKTAVYIDCGAVIEEGAIIYPMVSVKGTSVIRKGAIIRSGSVIENSVIKSGANILASFINDSVIGENTTVGPCSYVRGGSEIGNNVRIGDFVEVKASKLGDGCKAAHLTYIGDAELGISVNVGCGTVFANYNGKIKQKTYVGDFAFIGSNTNLVAPLKVGNYAYTAAGSTVTEDVPDNTLCIARARQVFKERKDR